MENSHEGMYRMNISFITNVGNDNLDYLKLLLQSLQDNLFYKEHEILVFVDRDNEKIVDYLKNIRPNFYDLKIITHSMPSGYVGYQLNINLLVKYAKYDVISYLQSDMVICKDYDKIIIEELENNCILSATRIEPPLHPPSSTTFTMDFGIRPTEFKMKEFIKYSEEVKSDKELQYFFAPFTFHRNTWDSVNGHDSLFRRSREDSDILQKFLHKGVKIKQTFKSNVYHFSCVSSRGKNWFESYNSEAQDRNAMQSIADGIELRKFVRKWGWFNHGEAPLTKYSIDLKIKNFDKIDYLLLFSIEHFFERIWVDSEFQKQEILRMVNENSLANKLIGISDEQWDEVKKFYNTTDFNYIYNVGLPEDYNCLITVDASNLDSMKALIGFVNTNIMNTLKSTEIGAYEYEDSFILDLKKLTNISDKNLTKQNPPFDYTLLKVE